MGKIDKKREVITKKLYKKVFTSDLYCDKINIIYKNSIKILKNMWKKYDFVYRFLINFRV